MAHFGHFWAILAKQCFDFCHGKILKLVRINQHHQKRIPDHAYNPKIFAIQLHGIDTIQFKIFAIWRPRSQRWIDFELR